MNVLCPFLLCLPSYGKNLENFLRLSETATNYTEYEFYNKKFNSLKNETKFAIR